MLAAEFTGAHNRLTTNKMMKHRRIDTAPPNFP
ncbi:hypothetical protein M2103_001707 [Ereboglobus sp. PH5-5]|nr:hypothetical protein [Ereboglobus sp. PH5-5]